MKTKNIILIALAGISIASCTQTVAVKQQHQIETVSELFDSLANRGISGQRALICKEDSCMYEEYSIVHSVQDNTAEHDFLLSNVQELLDRLCLTAENSYRYTSQDSLDYSIALGNEPQEYLYMKRWKDETERDWFLFGHSIKKPVNITLKSDDIESVQEMLKAFLSEQKGVKVYEVKYEWDSGVAIPDNYDKFLPQAVSKGRDADSLAVSVVTGNHYFIPAKDSRRIDVAVDFYNRLNRIATEQPRMGTVLSTTARFKEYLERGDWFADILRYSVYDYAAKRRIYNIMMEQSPEGIHILELNTADVPRFAIPRLWLKVHQTHNFDFIPEKDFEGLY